jgi:hypothetical protein
LHLEALGRLLRLSPDFEFDLVDLEHCLQGLSRAVGQSGVDLWLQPQATPKTCTSMPLR